MRHITQIIYFLGSLPGLGFLRRIAPQISRLGGFSSSLKATKTSLKHVKGENTNDDTEEENTEQSEDSK